MDDNKVIFALDVPTREKALELVRELGSEVGAFKIGLQLFTAAGPDIVREIVAMGYRVFLDVKFHDIPQTVANASIEVAKLGVWMFNVHVSGGKEMLRKTVEAVGVACAEMGIRKPLFIGVTVLTSSDKSTLEAIAIDLEPGTLAVRYALMAKECGLDGVVASPLEAATIRAAIDDDKFIIVTPGVRLAFATNNDQKRVTTPEQAIQNGADYLVIGRPIRDAKNRVDTVRDILGAISAAEAV